MKVGLGTSMLLVAGEMADQRARESGLAGAEIAGERDEVARLERDADVDGEAAASPARCAA